MLVCGIDFEATGLDTTKERIIEVGAVLFNAADEWAPIAEMSTLVWEPGIVNPPDAERVNGISNAELQAKGVPLQVALNDLDTLARKAKYFIAHNKGYDEQIFKAELYRLRDNGAKDFGFEWLSLPWLCSIEDVVHPAHISCRKLSHMAVDYGIVVDPATLHRAVGDIRLMGACLHAGKHSLDAIVKMAETPWVTVQAVVPKPWTDDGKGKDAAKALGYGWEKAPRTNGPTYSQSWVKRIKADKVEDERTNAPFKVKVLKE